MFLLDTNVVSELRRVVAGKGDPQVTDWFNGVSATDLYLSSTTIMELEIGILQKERSDIRQGQVLRTWFEDYVLPVFSGRMLSFDIPEARRCAQLHVPNPSSYRDAMIAATALVHSMTVVTRDVRGFSRTGAKILNPWEPETRTF